MATLRSLFIEVLKPLVALLFAYLVADPALRGLFDLPGIIHILIGIGYLLYAWALTALISKAWRSNRLIGFVNKRRKGQRRTGLRKTGVIAILLFLLLAPPLGFFAYWRVRVGQLSDEYVVAVARFTERGIQDEYHLTDEVIGAIDAILADYQDVTVLVTDSYPRTMEDARRLASRKRADLLIWGWYGISADVVRLSLRFEQLTTSTADAPFALDRYQAVVDICELESYEFQQLLGEEMGALVAFVRGVLHYNRGNYLAAYDLFEKALAVGEWPDVVCDRYSPSYLKGNCALHLGLDVEAVLDFDEALVALPDDAAALTSRGVAYARVAKMEASFRDLDRAIELDPTSAHAYANRGFAFIRAGDFAKAVADYDRALELSPLTLNYMRNRALSYLLFGKQEEAYMDLAQVLELTPEDTQTLRIMGLIEYWAGNCEEGLALIQKAVDLEPETPDNLIARGLVLSGLGDTERAIADYEVALAIDPSHDDVWANLALLHQSAYGHEAAMAVLEKGFENCGVTDHLLWRRASVFIGREMYEEALSDFDAIIALGDTSLEIHGQRGYALMMLGNYPSAIRELSRAIAEGDDPPTHLKNRAQCHGMQGDLESAIVDLTAAIALAPQNAELAGIRARVLLNLGRHDEARADIETALAIDPVCSAALLTRSRLNLLAERYSEAISDSTTVLSGCPTCPEAFALRGYAYQVIGDVDSALKDYDAALEHGPEDLNTTLNRGDLLLRTGRYERAWSDFSVALRQDPSLVVAYIGRGICSLYMEDPEGALNDLSQALDRDPNNADALMNRGLAYGELADMESAISDLEAAAHIAPESPLVLANLTTAYLILEEYSNVIRTATLALALDASFYPLLLQRGLAYFYNSELENAEADLQEYLQRAPTSDERLDALRLLEEIAAKRGEEDSSGE